MLMWGTNLVGPLSTGVHCTVMQPLSARCWRPGSTSTSALVSGVRTPLEAASNEAIPLLPTSSSTAWHQTLMKITSTKDSTSADNKYVAVLLPEKFPQQSVRLVKEIMRSGCVNGDGSPCCVDYPSSLSSLAACSVFRASTFPPCFHASHAGHDLLHPRVIITTQSTLPGSRPVHRSPAIVSALLAIGTRVECKTTHAPDDVRYLEWGTRPAPP